MSRRTWKRIQCGMKSKHPSREEFCCIEKETRLNVIQICANKALLSKESGRNWHVQRTFFRIKPEATIPAIGRSRTFRRERLQGVMYIGIRISRMRLASYQRSNKFSAIFSISYWELSSRMWRIPREFSQRRKNRTNATQMLPVDVIYNCIWIYLRTEKA